MVLSQPSRDVQVSPIEELKLKAQMEDDFGLLRHGLSYSVGGEEPKELVLTAPAAASVRGKAATKLGVEHLLDFEAMKAVPDQLVSYFFWAEDIGPDGQPRRSSGDMFFAEVRHFEEIFRQGEQPAGGSSESGGQQGDNAQEAGKLAELQRQIINGTWKVVRRETRSKPTESFAEDVKTLRESQQAVIEQAAQMGGRLRDQSSKASLEQVLVRMKEAEKHLGAAADTSSIKALTPALVAEQAASQALLKLRAREFQVTRSSRQRGQGGRSAGSPSQRQLQQLELKDDENRYEEQRTARSQEGQTQREREQRETRQVLNRLRELAQRQNDLNERLKELQSALEAAKTPEARDEIERQLKRLREQQQEILRDADELGQRMESEENQQRMAEARQQMEQSREHVRQASQALEEGRLPQALTEGARAGQKLNNLREQLRKDSSNKFSEEMTDLRDQARRLDENQKKINEQIDAWDKNPQHSLRDSEERKQVREGADQQRQKLDQIMDRMRNTTQEAEETEPLLAKNLYDTVKKATDQKIPEALKATQQLVDAGIAEEATKASHHAGQGIEQLRQGVERAAESVLGDGTEALRRAQSELDNLADQVNREIARGTGRETPQVPRPGSTPGLRKDAQPKAEGAPEGPNPEPREDLAQNDPTRSGQPGQRPRLRTQRQGQQGQPQGQQPTQGEQPGQQGQQGQQAQAGQPGQPQGQQGQQGDAGQRQGQQGQQGQRGQQGQQGQQAQAQGQQGPQGQQGQAQGQQGQQGQGQRGQAQGQQGQQGRQGGGQGQNRGGGGGGGGGNDALDRVADGIAGGARGPITGEGFRQWSDRMRDVEELLEDPDWRAEAAQIRDRVRGAREEFRRHSKEPDWTKLQSLVAEPIQELRNRIADEVRRRESPDALVPIDRDPVPPQFAEGVRRYYERLGSGQ